MIELKKSLARSWSRIGPRGIYGQSLLEMAKENEKIFAMSADLGNSSGLDRFKNLLPERYLNIGISEQNMIGFSSGLSSCSFNVFVSSFAPFLSLRAGEQVRMNLAYMKSNVKLVAIGSGISMGYLGNSHFGLEDISIIRSLPNILIVNPCDCFEVFKVIQALSSYDGPAYIRLTGAAGTPIVHHEDYQFKIGKFSLLKEGNEILLITYGSMCSVALKAANHLKDENNISVCVINLHTLRPVDPELTELLKKYKQIFVVEEHSEIGGLNSIVSNILLKENIRPNNFKCLSLPPKFLSSGTYEQLLMEYSLTPKNLIDLILQNT